MVLRLHRQKSRPYRGGTADQLWPGSVTRQEADRRAEQLLADLLTPD